MSPEQGKRVKGGNVVRIGGSLGPKAVFTCVRREKILEREGESRRGIASKRVV